MFITFSPIPAEHVEDSTQVYRKDGQLMAKCHLCTPEGRACDKCIPPAVG